VSFIERLEDIAAELYDAGAENERLASVYAEPFDPRWITAYNAVMDAIVALDNDDEGEV